MTQWKALSGTTALLMVLSTAAHAQVTGAEVWNNWKSAAESIGEILTPGSETQVGDTLTIRDLDITMDVPDVDVTGTIAMIEFRERDDGTVAITLSPSYEMQIAAAPETGESFDLTLQVMQEGVSIVASGGDGEISYDFLAPEITVSVAELVVDDEPMEMNADIVISDMNGSYTLTEGDMPRIASRLNAGEISFDVAAKEPGGSGTFDMSGAFADVQTVSDGSFAMMANMDDMAAMLKAGFATDAEFNYGASSFDMDFQDSRDSFAMSSTSESGGFSVAMDAEALSYEAGSTGLSFTMSGSEIPLPEIAASFAELGIGFLMPIGKSDTPQDFGAYLTLDGLAVSDMIWSMIDVGGALPHDPATLIVELAGKANWFMDIMDPEAQAEMAESGTAPGEIHALDIKEIRLSIAGAELTGQGGFTFDNSDLETFDGIPAPTGGIDLKLVGGNTLMDKLVVMGLLPQEEAMGARMMLGLFARPGEGDDTLESKIEITGDGGISANGQRLQ